jgi:hypothetical protein
MLISIPPKLAVSSVVGYIKGKSAIHVARHFLKQTRNYAGQSLWARGFFVDTVGRDTEIIRRYIQNQETEDQRMDQLEIPEVAVVAENKNANEQQQAALSGSPYKPPVYRWCLTEALIN